MSSPPPSGVFVGGPYPCEKCGITEVDWPAVTICTDCSPAPDLPPLVVEAPTPPRKSATTKRMLELGLDTTLKEFFKSAFVTFANTCLKNGLSITSTDFTTFYRELSPDTRAILKDVRSRNKLVKRKAGKHHSLKFRAAIKEIKKKIKAVTKAEDAEEIQLATEDYNKLIVFEEVAKKDPSVKFPEMNGNYRYENEQQIQAWEVFLPSLKNHGTFYLKKAENPEVAKHPSKVEKYEKIIRNIDTDIISCEVHIDKLKEGTNDELTFCMNYGFQPNPKQWEI